MTEQDIALATDRRDLEAAEAVRTHHAEMAGHLHTLTASLVDAAARGDATGAEAARQAFVAWTEGDLVPHALAEEKAMYPAAQALPTGRLLVDGMLAEHVVITDLVRRVAAADEPVRAAAYATAAQVLFDAHLAKENDLVLPLLAETASVSVADLLGGMHELLGGEGRQEEPAAAGHGHGHSCSCGEKDADGYPELDARAVPHAIRHATIFGALDAIGSGSGLVLVAPHDPLPLLAQVADRYSGAFEVSYLERGPEAWRLQLVRRAVA